MKKSLLLSAGIAYLTVILVSGGCSSNNGQVSEEPQKKVTVYLRSIEINKKKHLSMFDTNGNLDINDSLVTYVMAGGTVIWDLDKASGIKEIDRIYSKSNGPIFREDAKGILFSKKFRIEVPEGLTGGTQEEYFIDYYDQNGSKITRDPYLRIVP